ncbi:UNVERIFIED_CONTAM: hypothetical protein [Bacteriophage sp.]|jgi:hypothetical protein
MKFELELQEANVIMQALGNMPYAQVAGLIDKFRGQAQAQMEQPKAETNEG